MGLVNVQMERYELLELLMDRVKYWKEDQDIIDLYEKMYSNYIDNNAFCNITLNVMDIVDNDIINYCEVITKQEYPNDFEKLLELYHNDEYDISCENLEDIKASFIEAVLDNEEAILIRY